MEYDEVVKYVETLKSEEEQPYYNEVHYVYQDDYGYMNIYRKRNNILGNVVYTGTLSDCKKYIEKNSEIIKQIYYNFEDIKKGLENNYNIQKSVLEDTINKLKNEKFDIEKQYHKKFESLKNELNKQKPEYNDEVVKLKQDLTTKLKEINNIEVVTERYFKLVKDSYLNCKNGSRDSLQLLTDISEIVKQYDTFKETGIVNLNPTLNGETYDWYSSITNTDSNPFKRYKLIQKLFEV